MVRWAIHENKKKNARVNVRPRKTAESFSNSSFKKSLLNATFNNGSRHITVIKSCV
jgi:hypothetical protein